MELMNPWVKQGWEQGRQEGKEELLAGLISHRFGAISRNLTERLDALSSDQLDELSKALFDFKSSADLENWLSRHDEQ